NQESRLPPGSDFRRWVWITIAPFVTINKSLREVFDVTRMILSAKEELANELHPIDGLSGEYAEKSLEEWAEQIRKGGNQ
ncbi:hypothetical protein, partial [Escherichia coli]|uniref:hypothetical protein n=1 Tax=Escherichia coli TaxID=562 RepID=UPI001FCF26D8